MNDFTFRLTNASNRIVSLLNDLQQIKVVRKYDERLEKYLLNLEQYDEKFVSYLSKLFFVKNKSFAKRDFDECSLDMVLLFQESVLYFSNQLKDKETINKENSKKIAELRFRLGQIDASKIIASVNNDIIDQKTTPLQKEKKINELSDKNFQLS